MVGIEELVYAVCLWHKCEDVWYILIIHPFVDSIKYQLENNREKIFDDKNVLPKFKEVLYILNVINLTFSAL